MTLSFRRTLLLYTLVPCLAIFLLFAIENIISTKIENQRRIEEHLHDLARSYVNLFDSYLLQVVMQANIVENMLSVYPNLTEEEIFQFLKTNVEQDSKIYGMAVAFKPYQFDAKRKLFAPYVHRQGDKIKQIDIAQSAYDYTDPKWEWWHKPLSSEKGTWTEPYFDQNAGNILMSTYSVPFTGGGKVRGVVTVNIPLHQLNAKFKEIGTERYRTFMLSKKGNVLLSPNEDEIGESYTEIINKRYKTAVSLVGEKNADSIRNLHLGLVDDMLTGKEGKRITTLKGNIEGLNMWYYFAPVKSTGWSAAVGIAESKAFAPVYNRIWYAIIFFSILLLLLITFIVLASGKFSKAFEWIVNRCLRIERMNFQPAKKPATQIQEISHLSNTLDNMCQALNAHFSVKEEMRVEEAVRQQTLPNSVPNIPGYQIEIWSRSTGDGCGEVYDVIDLQQGGKVGFLLIKDSDKGIEATVKNAQLRAIFRTAIKHGFSPGVIADQMNGFLISDSLSNGPVQIWLGSLDTDKGKIVNLSLGQNSIFHLSTDKNKVFRYADSAMALSVQKELPVVSEQAIEMLPEDVIVVTSEGITAALSQKREVFGVKQIENLLKKHGENKTRTILDSIKQAFLTFTQNAYIETDCTIIVIKRLARTD